MSLPDALSISGHLYFRRVGAYQLQLLGGPPVMRILAPPQQAEDQPRAGVEQPDHRRGDARQPQHRQRHDRRDAFGGAQRELLGHQFVRDQRKIGGQADDDREARAAIMFGVEAEPDLISEEHTADLQSLNRTSTAILSMTNKNQ